jgi:hypothetical protein
MLKTLAFAALASALGVSMLFAPTNASAATIPAVQRDAAANLSQQSNLLQNVQFERRRWYRFRDGRRFRGDRFRANRAFRGDRLRYRNLRGLRARDGRWRGSRYYSPRYRYRPGYYAGFRAYPRGYYRDRWYYGRPYYRWRDRWDGPGWAFGLPLAFTAGAALAAPGYGYYGGYSGSAHVRWCASRYRSYDPRNNTWVGYSGRVYQCNSPYDGR